MATSPVRQFSTSVVTIGKIDIQCLSALCYTGQCQDCDRVQWCKLPEAHDGRLWLAAYKVAHRAEDLITALGELNELQGQQESFDYKPIPVEIAERLDGVSP